MGKDFCAFVVRMTITILMTYGIASIFKSSTGSVEGFIIAFVGGAIVYATFDLLKRLSE